LNGVIQTSDGKSLLTVAVDKLTGGIAFYGVNVDAVSPEVAPRLFAVLLGDSLVQFAKTESAVQLVGTSRDWFGFANSANGNQFVVMKNAGVAGQTCDQILARFDAEVTPYKPSLVVFDGLTNDMGAANNRSFAACWADILSIYAKCQSIGATLLFVGDSGANYSGTQAQILGQIYTACRQLEQQASGFIFHRVATAVRDYSTTTKAANGGIVAAYTPDNTHWNPVGAQTIGDYLAPVLARLAPPRDDRAIANHWYNKFDTPKDYGDYSNPIINGLMRYQFGGSIGSGGSGTLADYYTFARYGAVSAVLSNPARTLPEPGYWIQADVSGATALTDYITIQQYESAINTGAFSNCDIMVFDAVPASSKWITTIDIDATATSGVLNEVSVLVEILDGSNVVQFTGGMLQPYSTDQAGLTTLKGRFASLPITVPAAKVAGWKLRTTVKVRTGASTSVAGGAATVRIGALEMRLLPTI